MIDSSKLWVTIGAGFGVAVGATLAVILIGAILFGFDVGAWTEWEGRLVGVLATVAGAAGAFSGLLMASRRNGAPRTP